MKWLLFLVLIVGGAYLYWTYLHEHPQAAACGHFSELCGTDSRKQCDDAFEALRKASSPEDLATSAKCLKDAKTCAEAGGCLAGAAGKAGVNAAGQFLKGIGEALGK